jgi:flagellar motor component MotA
MKREMTERLIDVTTRLACAVHESGPIGLDGLIDDLVDDRLLAHCLRMFVDGLEIDGVRRHFARDADAERGRNEERYALLAAAIDLVAAGEQPSYIRFTLHGISTD